MKAITLFSDSRIVTNKMRDELYMKHLREVQKINNRESEQVTKEAQHYKSINDLHHKYKSNAFEWHSKQENQVIQEQNQKMSKKIKQMKSYLEFVLPHRPQSIDTSKLMHQQNQNNSLVAQKVEDPIKNQENNHLASLSKKQKQPLTLHYRYRKKRQEQIDRQNQKLAKGIMSQRGSYLPKIYKNKRSISVIGRNANVQKSQTALKMIQ